MLVLVVPLLEADPWVFGVDGAEGGSGRKPGEGRCGLGPRICGASCYGRGVVHEEGVGEAHRTLVPCAGLEATRATMTRPWLPVCFTGATEAGVCKVTD